MPYLSGPDLCGICREFGMPINYNWGGVNLSRWQYFDKLFDFCIENNKCSDLLSYLFGKNQFRKELSGLSSEEIDVIYSKIVVEVISQLNGILYFGGNELRVTSNGYIVCKIGEQVKIEVPKIKTIDRQYVTSIAERAMKNVEDNNFDSAISQSRTLLEEVFCYMIEKKEETPSESGDINKLYNQVRQLYGIHQDAQTDKRINDLINGINKIIGSISEMRNKDSDAHGVGSKRVDIKDYHARLYVNTSVSLSEFMLALMGDSESILRF